MKKIIKVLILFLLIGCIKPPIKTWHGLFPIKEYGKWGYINTDGKTIIKCQFDWAGEFSEGLSAILKDSLYGFIDTTGKIVIEPKYRFVSRFSDGLCNVIIKKDTTYQTIFIKKDGTIAFTTNYDYVGDFNSGRASVKINKEVCFINKSGDVVIHTGFRYGHGFHDGIAAVWDTRNKAGDSKSKYIDTNGRTIREFNQMNSDEFSEGLAIVQENDSNFYIDKTGKQKIILKHLNCAYFNFSDGLAQIVIPGGDHKSGFIDTTGRIVIPIAYHEISDFKEGLAAYKDKDCWGFIDKKGKVAIKPQFDEIENYFTNGLCRVKQNHQSGYINHKGEYVWKEQVGIEYNKLELSKWNLDTLEINYPLEAQKYAGGDNYPRKKTFVSLNTLTINIDTIDLTVFDDKYFAYKIYLINAGKDTIKMPAQSGRIKLIQQAINKKSEWQDIENYINDWCGNTYHTLRLAPNEYQIFAAPIYKGKFQTQLRFKLILDKHEIYSNEYIGKINLKQFLNPKDKDNTGIAVMTY